MSQRKCFVGVDKQALVGKKNEAAEEMNRNDSSSKPSVQYSQKGNSFKSGDDASNL